MKKTFLFSLILSLFISTYWQKTINISPYNYPKPLSSPFLERIAIIGTNDIHGHILPKTYTLSSNSSETFRAGGLTLMASYIEAFKEEWGENLLWLDAGDQFQGNKKFNNNIKLIK